MPGAFDYTPALLGSKPKRITLLTSAAPTGTYVPTEDMARCLIRVQAGGGGGWGTAGNAGGGGGAMIEEVVRIPIAGWAYVVGAGGAVSTAGSPSTLGPFGADGGKAPSSSVIPGIGGLVGMAAGTVSATATTVSSGGSGRGVTGGGGGYAASGSGFRAGTPIAENHTVFGTVSPVISHIAGLRNGAGAASGGSSFYGIGGANGQPPAADAYGAGAGSGVGTGGVGGCIEIWDFGA